jgi:anoctamin-10
MREIDLSLRWEVRGVGSLKVNRAKFKYDKEIRDPITNELIQQYSHTKQVLRQLLQIPFALIALLGLGSLIGIVFIIEIFISEVYEGPFKFYLVCNSHVPCQSH